METKTLASASDVNHEKHTAASSKSKHTDSRSVSKKPQKSVTNGHTKEAPQKPTAKKPRVDDEKRTKKRHREETDDVKSADGGSEKDAASLPDWENDEDNERATTVRHRSKSAKDTDEKPAKVARKKPKSKPRGLNYAIPNAAIRQALQPFHIGQDAIDAAKWSITMAALVAVARCTPDVYSEKRGVPCFSRIDPKRHHDEAARPPTSHSRFDV